MDVRIGRSWLSVARGTLLCGLLFGLGCAGEISEEQAEEPALIEERASNLTSSLAVVEDAYVRAGSYADRNFGRDAKLRVGGSSSSQSFSLLKFSVPVSGNVSSATLRVYGGVSGQRVTIQARSVGSGWSESSVTQRSAPVPSSSVIASRTVSTPGWQTFDLTSYVRANLGQSLSVALTAQTASAYALAASFNARESSANQPVLLIASEESCTPRSCGSSCGTIDDGCGGTVQCTQCPTSSNKMVIGANFWRHTWGNGTGDYFKPGLDFRTTSDPWQPQLLSDLAYAKVLRFMDWGPVNGSQAVRWADRVPKTGNQYGYEVPLSRADGSTETGEGVAYEWQIDLANRTGADLWINVPHAADDDFVVQLARLIQTQLRSDKKVYVEYSNEVWNSGFYQNKYSANKAASSGLPSTVSYKGKSVTLEPWLSYSTFRALSVFGKFEEVFGKDSPRLVKVLAGQLGYNNWPDYVNTWGDIHPLVNQHMAAIHSPLHNPQNIKVNAYALAPYWGGATVTDMRNALGRLEESMREARRALDLEGTSIPLVCYEAGQDGDNQVRNARDPAIYQLTLDAYTRFKPFLNGPFVTYTHVGWDGNYAWGLKQSTSASLADSHKYRATLDWVRANP
jgi:hypothetical protein